MVSLAYIILDKTFLFKTRRMNLEETADMWYERTKKLFGYVHNLNNPPHKREKAYKLWQKMYVRCLNIARLYMDKMTPLPKFPPGATPSAGRAIFPEKGKELAVNEKGELIKAHIL